MGLDREINMKKREFQPTAQQADKGWEAVTIVFSEKMRLLVKERSTKYADKQRETPVTIWPDTAYMCHVEGDAISVTDLDTILCKVFVPQDGAFEEVPDLPVKRDKIKQMAFNTGEWFDYRSWGNEKVTEVVVLEAADSVS